jgi:hypothetical protein
MRSFKNTFTICLLSFTAALTVQTTLPVPRNIQTAFDKGTRSMLGIPGKNYWQNFASYDIQVRFGPATGLISGTEDITYTNNCPDTLRKLSLNCIQQP